MPDLLEDLLLGALSLVLYWIAVVLLLQLAPDAREATLLRLFGF